METIEQVKLFANVMCLQVETLTPTDARNRRHRHLQNCPLMN